MIAIAVFLGLIGLLYGIYIHSKIKRIRQLGRRANSLLGELRQRDDWRCPEAQDTIRQMIAVFHEARQVEPRIDRQLDTERTIVQLLNLLEPKE